ncbi:MAG: transposase [Euryarchaeota archaeon]|nr:transposase [Euryarchaeota archaeon]
MINFGGRSAHLPAQKPKTGRPRANLRKTFNGILHVLYRGCRWEEVPGKYGAKSTVHRLNLKLAEEDVYKDYSIFSCLKIMRPAQ